MPRRRSRAHAGTCLTARTRSSSSRARLASTSWRVSRHSPTGRSFRISQPTSTRRSWQRRRDPSIQPPPSANISPPRDARAPASLSHRVRGASPSREQDGPLSLAARLGLYAMLASLVLASFTITPQRPAPVIVAPSDDVADVARIAPVSRGTIRWIHDSEDLAPPPSPPLTPEGTDLPAAEAVLDTQ